MAERAFRIPRCNPSHRPEPSVRLSAQLESIGSENGVFLSFSDFSLSPVMLESVRQRGHRQPTAIQSGAIPIALSGRDLIATAETGSGKTAAFLLPILNRLHGEQSNRIGALVLAPTRELAFQIGEEFRLLSRNTRMRAAVIVGGESIDRQIRELRAGVQLVVACPGRLVDRLDRGTVKLATVSKWWLSTKPTACSIWAFSRNCAGFCARSGSRIRR